MTETRTYICDRCGGTSVSRAALRFGGSVLGFRYPQGWQVVIDDRLVCDGCADHIRTEIDTYGDNE